eukprot:1158920-Pelagomonas_calceolata.AAC.6
MTLPYKSASVHLGPLRVKLQSSPALNKLILGTYPFTGWVSLASLICPFNAKGSPHLEGMLIKKRMEL